MPIQYADFIFSAIGEQLGFLGSAIVIGLYGLVGYRVFRAIQVARDSLGRLLCAGVLAFLVVSVFENIGMATGIMPITGIPLPFISYGGSALIAFSLRSASSSMSNCTGAAHDDAETAQDRHQGRGARRHRGSSRGARRRRRARPHRRVVARARRGGRGRGSGRPGRLRRGPRPRGGDGAAEPEPVPHPRGDRAAEPAAHHPDRLRRGHRDRLRAARAADAEAPHPRALRRRRSAVSAARWRSARITGYSQGAFYAEIVIERPPAASTSSPAGPRTRSRWRCVRRRRPASSSTRRSSTQLGTDGSAAG